MHVVWLELIIHPTALLVFQELPPSDELEPVQRNRTLRFFDWREWTLITLIGTLVIALIVVGCKRSLGSNNLSSMRAAWRSSRSSSPARR
jgi:Ca2+-transporting ATPase